MILNLYCNSSFRGSKRKKAKWELVREALTRTTVPPLGTGDLSPDKVVGEETILVELDLKGFVHYLPLWGELKGEITRGKFQKV